MKRTFFNMAVATGALIMACTVMAPAHADSQVIGAAIGGGAGA